MAYRINHLHLKAPDPRRTADWYAHHGLEHCGLDSTDIDADIGRLRGLGAELLEGPIDVPGGGRIAFLRAPDDTRVELVPRRAIAGGSGDAGGCC